MHLCQQKQKGHRQRKASFVCPLCLYSSDMLNKLMSWTPTVTFQNFINKKSLFLCSKLQWKFTEYYTPMNAQIIYLLLPIALRPFQFGLGFPYNWCLFLSIQCFRYILYISLKFITLKHLKCSYMFWSLDHPQGARIVPC